MKKEVEISLDSKALDQAIEKANRLAELLREVHKLSIRFLEKKSQNPSFLAANKETASPSISSQLLNSCSMLCAYQALHSEFI